MSRLPGFGYTSVGAASVRSRVARLTKSRYRNKGLSGSGIIFLDTPPY